MKRNHIMRTSAIVLALVLATACLVSGTFAKYTTTMGGTDTARVAYFEFGSDVLGVDQVANFNLWDTVFDPNVLSPLNGAETNIGEDGMKLLAPGTYGNIDFNLWGKAEVDTWVDFNLTLTTDAALPLVFQLPTWNLDYVSLPEGYDYTTSPVFSDYYPVGTVVTVTAPINTGDDEREFVATPEENIFKVTVIGNLADLSKAMDKFLAAGTALEAAMGAQENLTWFWCFEEYAPLDLDAGDDRDTTLGNNAVVVEGDRENGRTYTIKEITATLDVTCTVTQID